MSLVVRLALLEVIVCDAGCAVRTIPDGAVTAAFGRFEGQYENRGEYLATAPPSPEPVTGSCYARDSAAKPPRYVNLQRFATEECGLTAGKCPEMRNQRGFAAKSRDLSQRRRHRFVTPAPEAR